MYVSNDNKALTYIKWGIRLLWLELFIVLMVPMGKWYHPFTFWMVGGCMCLLLAILSCEKYLLETEELESILGEELVLESAIF